MSTFLLNDAKKTKKKNNPLAGISSRAPNPTRIHSDNSACVFTPVFCFEYQLSSDDRGEQKERLVHAPAFFLSSRQIQTGLQRRERWWRWQTVLYSKDGVNPGSLCDLTIVLVSLLVQMWECPFFNPSTEIFQTLLPLPVLILVSLAPPQRTLKEHPPSISLRHVPANSSFPYPKAVTLYALEK